MIRPDGKEWAERFPALFAPAWVAYADSEVRFAAGPPPDDLVSRLHVVGRSRGGVVVCGSDLGWRFLPGGTREPGETLEGLVDRELREEAGARRTGPLCWVGAHHAHCKSPAPYRSHLPHPDSYWAYAVTDMEIEGPPTNPVDGEQVVEVQVLPVSEAAAYLAGEAGSIQPHVLLLAEAMGLV